MSRKSLLLLFCISLFSLSAAAAVEPFEPRKIRGSNLRRPVMKFRLLEAAKGSPLSTELIKKLQCQAAVTQDGQLAIRIPAATIRSLTVELAALESRAAIRSYPRKTIGRFDPNRQDNRQQHAYFPRTSAAEVRNLLAAYHSPKGKGLRATVRVRVASKENADGADARTLACSTSFRAAN
jgi:hypothetical protein